MGTNKTALFVEWNCQRTITRANLQNSILSFAFLGNKINQGFCITFALVFLNCRNILDFKHTISFIGYDTLTFNTIIIKYIHPTIIKVTVYHIFLLICQ